MHSHRSKFIKPVFFSICLLSVLFLSATAAQAEPSGPPTVFTVGSGPDCQYGTLRDALAAATLLVTNKVEIRESWDIDHSLSYSFTGHNSEVQLIDPAPGAIEVIGGYASCSASMPSAGVTTQLVTATPQRMPVILC